MDEGGGLPKIADMIVDETPSPSFEELIVVSPQPEAGPSGSQVVSDYITHLQKGENSSKNLDKNDDSDWQVVKNKKQKLGNNNPTASPAPPAPLAPPVSPAPNLLPPAHTSKTPRAPRRRVYQGNSTDKEWNVYFQPKNKPLNVVNIGKDLERLGFSAVTDISKVRPNRLRVIVSDWKQANKIGLCEHFTKEYRVYISARDVEIDGVITEEGLSCEILREEGVGRFKNPALPQVKILECQQLTSASLDDNNQKVYRPTNSFRVTFAGKALPNYVTIGKARLPVRLYVPRVMYCLNCKQIGHTATYCNNKARCGKCGEKHLDDSCQQLVLKCPFCGGENPHAISACPVYIQRSDKKKRQLKADTKRSYASMLQQFPPTDLQNTFDLLSDDDSDDDVTNEGSTFALPGGSGRKRKHLLSPGLPRKGPKKSDDGLKKKPGGGVKKDPKNVPPGFGNYNQQFPPLPGTSKTPDVPFSQSDNQSKGLFAFSDIVDKLLSALNVPENIRSILTALLPLVKSFLQQLTVKWPLLSAIISFDD